MSGAVFDHYARYYDLLYRDKDYATEAAYVAALLQEHAPGAATLVELGCGTGTHAELLARLGYTVHGVDMSEAMVERANARRAALAPELAARLSFSVGDARSVRLGVRADAVISLFHVMSYQSTNADLGAAFETARAHLAEGGLFLFDCWHGPSVLTDPPVLRIKRLADQAIEVERIAEPTLHYNDNLVDVHYDVRITELASGVRQQLHETHRMRYLFPVELDLFAEQAGMRRAFIHEWLTREAPLPPAWGACYGMRLA